MNAAYLHLALNHIPVLGAVFGLGLLLWARWKGSDELARTALGVLVLVGVAAVAVYLTGEPAEELVEELSGVSHERIEAHEEAAMVATIVSGLVGIGAFIILYLHKGRELAGWATGGALVGALVLCGILAWTANRGGKIRHPEIRGGFEAPVEEAGEEHGGAAAAPGTASPVGTAGSAVTGRLR